MTVNKRNKKSRMRGSHTHGWGAMKKHRGAGNRGGRGWAGTGKRADSKKPSIWKDKDYFGRGKFTYLGAGITINPINISYFEQKADKLVAEKLIEKKGNIYEIDVEKLGYNKVLGCGKITKKMKISSPFFSEKSIKRIEAVGGQAVITKAEKKEKPKVQKPEAK